MGPVTIQYKSGFRIEEKAQIYPLYSHISDTIGVIAEHRKLNGNNKYLRYGLQKIKDEYYFFDVRNTVNQNTKDKDFSEYICPYCKEKMFIVSSFERGKTTVPMHLKHYKKTNRNCIFRTDKNSLKLKEEYYNSDDYLTREMLDCVYNKLKNNNLTIRIPKGYKALKNVRTNEVRIEVQHETETVIRVQKGEDKFKDGNLPYIPHLIFYTDKENEVYCEITVKNSKSISQYYEIWKENQKTVLEIKKVEDPSLFPSKFLFEGDLSLTYLYDPILDKAKRQKLLAAKKLADKQRKEFEKNRPKLKVSKKQKRELRMEVANIAENYMQQLVDKNEIKVGSGGIFIDKNNNELKYKDITIQKENIITGGLIVYEIAINEIKRHGYIIK